MNTSGSIPCDSPQLGRKKIIWAVVTLALLLLLGVLGYHSLHKYLNPPSVVIASFPGEFSDDSPPAPWHYLWNANGALGAAANYADLKWSDHYHIYLTGIGPKYPEPTPAGYLRLAGGSGHTGAGRTPRNPCDRFIIVAYTIEKTGKYSLMKTGIRRHAGANNGSVEVRVLVNDRAISLPFVCQSEEKIPFDRDLGRLAAGDTIYVSVGPNGSDRDDSFDLQFSIATRPR